MCIDVYNFTYICINRQGFGQNSQDLLCTFYRAIHIYSLISRRIVHTILCYYQKTRDGSLLHTRDNAQICRQRQYRTVVVSPLFCKRAKPDRDAAPWMAAQGRQGTRTSRVDRSRPAAICISRLHKTASRTERCGMPCLYIEHPQYVGQRTVPPGPTQAEGRYPLPGSHISGGRYSLPGSHISRGRYIPPGAQKKRSDISPTSQDQLSIVPGCNYSMMVATRPEPTVWPPSRIAKVRPCSIAMGWMSSMVISTLSPGMHISVPSGRLQTPVISVVRK